MQDLILGVDIGGTNSAGGLVDSEGKILLDISIPTRSDHRTPAELLQKLRDRVQAEVDGLQFKAVGIGAPNANCLRGTIENPPNLDWQMVDLKSVAEAVFQLPSAVLNDADAAALGEARFGAGRGLQDFVQVTLGTGIGTGVILGGELWTGSHGWAGELGHATAVPGGRMCGCGRRGCLETYAAARGLVQNLLDQQELHPECGLFQKDRDRLTAAAVYRAAEQGDKAALAAFDTTGRHLGMALANTVTLLDPEAFILGGGVAHAGKYLLEPVRRHLNDNLLSIYRGEVEVLLSQLAGENAAVLGAAAYARKLL